MTTTTDTAAELRELANLNLRHELIEKAINERLVALRFGKGVQLQELGAALGKSESQMSRILKALEKTKGVVVTADKPVAATAMELVRQAQRGEISHEEFIELLKHWNYDPQYKTQGEADDWEVVDNSFDAVYHAYVGLDLLSDEEYEEIESAAA
ncbi:MAG: hypothetical protein CMF56_12180 [Leifsonia sp.]|uniref:hypothetical protein n=1 Tax=Microbacterium TaxID=33882 RepID=UPI000C6323E2|nr:hypothetical protein [Microbacterium paraoxydans]MAT19290.1 hypothetical protein [Leifsonia sp.]MCT2225413.1 hypothetical protein [Microbacterium paraoxydans]|tara:strand:- start:277 stop:741 length:465 start_codon:yes stop_codon:yes gene_type:complete